MRPWLRVEYTRRKIADLLSDENHRHILGFFRFGGTTGIRDPRVITLPLPELDGHHHEIWWVDESVQSGRFMDLSYQQCPSLTLAHMSLRLDRQQDLENATRRAYEQILAFLHQHEHGWPLKIWHYFPGITAGEGDAEPYRRFCAGRAYAVTDDPLMMTAIPAATAIGSHASENELLIYFLAGHQPGRMVENPRQVPAPRYPARYSKQSPLFSRGTLIESGETHQFLISGTASILGHESCHENDVREQTREALRNLTALISAGRRLAPVSRERRKRFVRAGGVLRVYVKNSDDRQIVAEELARHPLGKLPAVYLRGDICRQELLVEIDGIF